MVLLRKLSNGDAGTSTTLGGNDTDKVADYFNDVDVSEIVKINTDTRFRSGKASLRDGSNAFNISLKSATQTADRDWTIPALAGNDSPATLGLSNIFTALQQITLDADTLMSFYRPSSVTNSLNSIAFYHRNSINASTKYASIASQVITNTNALEDGKLKFFVKKAGVDTEVMSIDKNGLLTVASVSTGGGTAYAATDVANTFTQIQTISSDNQRLLKLYRPTNTVNNIVGLEMDHRNSANAQVEFGRYDTKLITNTAGAEDGLIEEYVVKAGTITKVRTIDKNGAMIVGPSQNVAVGGYLKNSGVPTTTASSSTEFDLLNYSVPANLLGANGCLRVRLTGSHLQNQATATDFTWKIKFGGTTVFQSVRTAIGQSATVRPFVLEFTFGNVNATNSQRGTGIMMMNDADTDAGTTTGEGTFNDDEINITAPFRTTDPAKDTTSAQTLQITMTHSVNSSSVSTTVQRQIIEFIPGI